MEVRKLMSTGRKLRDFDGLFVLLDVLACTGRIGRIVTVTALVLVVVGVVVVSVVQLRASPGDPRRASPHHSADSAPNSLVDKLHHEVRAAVEHTPSYCRAAL